MRVIPLGLIIAAALPAAEPLAILAHNCYACHTRTQMGGLQLDSREAALKGGKSGPAIVPGNPEGSLLMQAVTYKHDRLKMPPTSRLSDDEVRTLAAWIKDGAKYPDAAPVAKSKEYVITPEQRKFWAFQPVKPSPLVPAVKENRWAKTNIDRFVLDKMEAKGLKPSAAADRRTLIRRATLDLTGLPPTPAEVDAFLKDASPTAFAKVVDRLLASPRYGERWGRHWLDVARYSDDKLDSERDNPYANAFRYRDWVIQAFNDDMPFTDFVKAQIAGDLMPAADRLKYEAGLGFYALSPEFQDDRVDATSRGFLGLTVACAQCHDHKFDPIPTKDYYSMLGVFTSSKVSEYPLAPDDEVKAWQAAKKKVDDQKKAIADFVKLQAGSLAEIFAAKAADYLMKEGSDLDSETAERWAKYLANKEKSHPFLKAWEASHSRKDAEAFQQLLLTVAAEKKRVDEENRIILGLDPSRNDLSQANLKSLERDRFVLWDNFFGNRGVLYYDDKKIDRFLGAAWKKHLDEMRATLAVYEKDLPKQYPFLHTLTEGDKIHDERIQIRGSRETLGDVAPRRPLAILSGADPKPFSKGSGRLELAEFIASADNPLTARVIVNRIWQHHFGQGFVRTPSNFGQLGERPSHPELLDYLARWFMNNGWSIKKLHREIMLSATYSLSAVHNESAFQIDPENRLLWRFPSNRLDAEALRDSLLFVAGDLDLQGGGAPQRLTDDFRKRAVYGYVSRRRLDSFLSLFDFPNPNNTSERRIETDVPLQRLFFMNSDLMVKESKAFAGRLAGTDEEKIRAAYAALYSRAPLAEELKLGLEFLKDNSWPTYAQALLTATEFVTLR